MSRELIEKAVGMANPEDASTLRRHIICHDQTILDGLQALNLLSGDTRTLFVIDEEGRLAGSITDGDIRRALISGSALESEIGGVCRKGCIVIEDRTDIFNSVSKARERGIKLLPLLKDGYIQALVDLRKRKGFISATGVLMAGGVGERLRPLTLTTPKPLLEVGGKAIIDYNIELMKAYGVNDVFITVNYLKEKIEEHIRELEAQGLRGVKCIPETKKLGTMGSLALLPEIKTETVIVMNSDLLTDINLEKMYRKHIDSGADMTIAVTPYTVSIPFAIMDHNGDRVTAISEKPTYNYFANAGIYMIRKEVAEGIEKNTFLDAPELAENLINEGKKVVQFVIHGSWIDIGSPDDYRQACDIMSRR